MLTPFGLVAFLALALAGGLVGCGLLAGLGADYSIAPEASAVEASDGTVDQGVVPDAGMGDTSVDGSRNDTSTGPDAPQVDSTAPHGDAAVDEDAAVDVQSGCACMAVPSGWSLIAYSPTATQCLAPYDQSPKQVVLSASALATCTCACATATCEGAADVNLAASPGSCTFQSTFLPAADDDGNCQGAGNGLTVEPGPYFIAATPPTPQCGMSTPTLPMVTVTSATTCQPAASQGSGCAAGEVCAPPVGSDFSQCISFPTKQASCPPGFGLTPLVVSVGTPGYVDDRACNNPSCQCTTSLTCTTPSAVKLYASPGCSGTPDYTVTSVCSAPSSKFTVESYSVQFNFNGLPTCTPSGSATPSGGVTLDSNLMTICCP